MSSGSPCRQVLVHTAEPNQERHVVKVDIDRVRVAAAYAGFEHRIKVIMLVCIANTILIIDGPIRISGSQLLINPDIVIAIDFRFGSFY